MVDLQVLIQKLKLKGELQIKIKTSEESWDLLWQKQRKMEKVS